MKAPRLRAWNKELKMMELPEEIFTRDNIHMLLNKTDYIWMRSTELFDKDGKEIFEGDIIFNARIKIGEIRLDLFYHALLEYGIYADKELKVIGNIYENPELMEKQEC